MKAGSVKKAFAVMGVILLTTVIIFSAVTDKSDNTIKVAGSTTVLEVMLKFQEKYGPESGTDIYAMGNGSGAGISYTANGLVDIGMLSRDLSDSEKKLGLTEYIIARDAVAIILNAEVADAIKRGAPGPINLVKSDLKKIYDGTYTNWNQVFSWVDIPIAPAARESGSGTRDCFEDAIGPSTGENMNYISSTGGMLAAVGSVPGGIGYVNLNILDQLPSTVVYTMYNGSLPSVKTVVLKEYGMSRDVLLVTGKSSSAISVDFINWILSPKGQSIIFESGFVPINWKGILWATTTT